MQFNATKQSKSFENFPKEILHAHQHLSKKKNLTFKTVRQIAFKMNQIIKIIHFCAKLLQTNESSF